MLNARPQGADGDFKITHLYRLLSLNLIDRYVTRQVLVSFSVVLGALTAIVWLTSSLRQLDLVVSQGQTFWLFMKVTLLALPLLIGLIAPFCLFIAALFVLNKLNSDSELIVMSAAGIAQHSLARPFLAVAILITLSAYGLALFITPISLRTVRQTVISARADFISQAIRPGRFTTVDQGLTFHVRERSANGVLQGVFVHDTRDPEVSISYLGARGVITRAGSGNFLVLQQGEVVRRPRSGAATGSVISFESYAFSLAAPGGDALTLFFPAQERSTAELIELMGQPFEDQRFAGRVRSEFNDRLATPLYSLAFVLIAFAAMGRAKTTRQSLGESIVLAVAAVGGLRILGFFASGLVARNAWAVPLIYAVPILGIALAGGLGLSKKTINFKSLWNFWPNVVFLPFLRSRP